VLMDLQMPVMDGHTAARAIRQWEAGQGTARAVILSLTGGAVEVDASSDGEPICDAQLSSHIGKSLESAAGTQSRDEIRLQIGALRDYLAGVKVAG